MRIRSNLQELGTKTKISFYVSFKGFCYIYKKSVFSFYFEIDTERNLHFVPNSLKLYLILILILANCTLFSFNSFSNSFSFSCYDPSENWMSFLEYRDVSRAAAQPQKQVWLVDIPIYTQINESTLSAHAWVIPLHTLLVDTLHWVPRFACCGLINSGFHYCLQPYSQQTGLPQDRLGTYGIQDSTGTRSTKRSTTWDIYTTAKCCKSGIVIILSGCWKERSGIRD